MDKDFWNKLSQTKPGKKMILGYLKVRLQEVYNSNDEVKIKSLESKIRNIEESLKEYE